MTFPTTISTLVQPYHGVGGPFLSSAGIVYVVTRDSSGIGIQVFKSADPSGSWGGAANVAVTSGNTVRAVNAYQVGDILHIVSRDAFDTASNQIRYHVFDMTSDTFTTSNQLVKTTYTQKGTVDESRVGIIVRSDGTKIVVYEGPQVLADIQRARTYYARYMGAAWSADIALDNGGNIDWYPQEMALGSADRVHFFMLDATNSDLYQRALTSANALETFPSAFDNDVAAGLIDNAFQRPVAYSGSASGTVVRLPYYDTYDASLADVRFTSVDAPSPTVTTDITGTINPAGFRQVISLANDGNTVYGAFVNSNAPLAFDNAKGTANSVGSGSRGLLVTATANAVLLVFTTNPGDVTVSAVNVGVNQLTRLQGLTFRADTGAPWRTEMWGLTAPATGTLTVSATLVGLPSVGWAMQAITFTGHRTSATPFGGTVVSSASASASTSIIVSSTAGNIVVMSFALDEANASVGPGLTNRGFVADGVKASILIAQAPGASNVTGSASSTLLTRWGNLGINLIASATTTQGIYLMSSQDAGSWSTPIIFQSGTPDSIWTNCYVRSSVRVVGVIYQDTATLYYTEYTLSVGSSVSLFAARLGLLGVGR